VGNNIDAARGIGRASTNHDRRGQDLVRVTCVAESRGAYLEIWLSGYYHGKRGDTEVDVQKLKDDAEKVRSYCLYNKGTLMEAVEKVLSAER